MKLPGIFRGQTYATAGGEEFTVVNLDAKNGYAVIETLSDEQGVIDLGAMLEAIQSGGLVNIDEKDDGADSEEELGE